MSGASALLSIRSAGLKLEQLARTSEMNLVPAAGSDCIRAAISTLL